MEANPGDIVCSKAGRDKFGYFVVMSVDGDYAQICDGRKRKIQRPKLKKIKHLRLGLGHSDYIENKLRNGDKVTNSEIRRELIELNSVEPDFEREC